MFCSFSVSLLNNNWQQSRTVKVIYKSRNHQLWQQRNQMFYNFFYSSISSTLTAVLNSKSYYIVRASSNILLGLNISVFGNFGQWTEKSPCSTNARSNCSLNLRTCCGCLYKLSKTIVWLEITKGDSVLIGLE